jgi:hypothetical protein
MGAGFPEITLRNDYLLSAILERLGLLLAGLKIPDSVQDVAPLSLDYLEELLRFAHAKAQEIAEAGTD